MTAADLLPSNATTLERDLSRSGDVLPRLAGGVERIRDAKRNDIPDSVVPWLIYEYGLGEITPYVPDLRRALAEGIQWQRLRGTRAAIEIGLGWIGFDAEVEESEARTLRWADFQMGLDQAPNGLEFTNNVIQISRLSAPIRSRLFRIYGGYDYRRFRLDDHLLSEGSWLCDDTGVYLRPDWPQLSFGREFHGAGDILGDAVAALSIERTRTDEGIYEDRFILSNSHLSDLIWRTWHMEDPGVTVSRGHLTVAGPWWLNTTGWAEHSWDQGLDWAGIVNRIAPPLKFAKAGIYLSDGGVLGDTNYCFSARLEEEVGAGAFLLSEGDPATGEGILSQHTQRPRITEVLERLERGHSAVTQAAADAASSLSLKREHQRVIPYDDTFRLSQHLLCEWVELVDQLAVTRQHTGTHQVTASDPSSWDDTRWLDASTWVNTFGVEHHQTFSKAALYLSESEPLGDTNAAFNVAISREIGYEAFQLSEADPQNLLAQEEFEYLAELGYLEETGQGVIVLSEGDPVSGNSVLSEHVSDSYLLLDSDHSGLHRISEHVQRIVWDPIDERFDRDHFAVGLAAAEPGGGFSVVRLREHQRLLPYDDTFRLDQHLLCEWAEVVDRLAVTRAHTSQSTLLRDGESWEAHSWWEARGGWTTTGAKFDISIEYAGHLTLSEGQRLGDTLAVLGWPELLREERSHQTEQLEPSQASGELAALNREHQRVLPYDSTFLLDQHLLSEWWHVTDGEPAITREHTTSANGTAAHASIWEEATWVDASTWQAQNGLVQYLHHSRTGLYLSDSDPLGSTHAALSWPTDERFDRDHFATAAEDRQTVETRQHTRASQTTLNVFGFYSWSDPVDWTVGTDATWSDEAWPDQAMWAEGNGYWNPTAPLISSQHESST